MPLTSSAGKRKTVFTKCRTSTVQTIILTFKCSDSSLIFKISEQGSLSATLQAGDRIELLYSTASQASALSLWQWLLERSLYDLRQTGVLRRELSRRLLECYATSVSATS